MLKISKIGMVAAFFAMVLVFAACKEKSFKISGTIEGAEGKCVVLQRADHAGVWLDVDSVKVGSDGSFKIKGTAAEEGDPQIYRLLLDGKFVCFPVLGAESLSLRADVKDFGTTYTLEGSETAVKMAEFDVAANSLDYGHTQAVSDFKRKVFTEIIQPSQADILSYYVLTKTHNGQLLFNPENPDDAKYFSAVATLYKQYRPDDPRAGILEQLAIAAQRNRNKLLGRQAQVEAPEVSMIEIDLPDLNNNRRKLSEVVGQGRPAILVFNVLSADKAVDVTKALGDLRTARGGNLDIYQVGYDPDPHAWSRKAASQPWVNVYDIEGTASANLRNYNVTSLPRFFIFNSAGDIIDSTDDPAALPALLRNL